MTLKLRDVDARIGLGEEKEKCRGEGETGDGSDELSPKLGRGRGADEVTGLEVTNHVDGCSQESFNQTQQNITKEARK